MSEGQDRYIPGVPCWVDTTQPDPEAAVAFYGGLFGWEFEDVMPPGSPVSYHVARLRGGDVAAVGTEPEGASPAAAWNSYVWVTDADETAAKVRAAGGSVLVEPADVPDAGRMAVFADPEGATFRAWQAGTHRGAAIVNEPGSLNFNDLHARDLDGAAAFYGAVFGWELLDLGGWYAWALAGYGDFLAARTPGWREGMAEVGAPERFEDVVASVIPITDDQPGVTPHWGLTFAVDDADTVAARAAELGGRVVVPPFDAPWVRMTVITDPQGATFTASKFVPENQSTEESTEAPTGA
ncbi:MAG TPA: VOC family protein [Solirubrobacteraceae bacterium]|nr:VOC family protein [Solirubrobacteraceae bacterium]